ncbi:hypothetical protein GV792_13620 [Nocardia cyriacigeorgica]|uniref:Uncharacterized protein n=1 Tax=Nocardia cyriacigeorgica TaxID=135487 RepID=A0A6P1D774_9NOCA|nr:hypothetical protein [Nocardia cyriacigeorgica]NEW40681.1 hypothetical protein [Nocardia cyriacigeorgica]NEW44072.1 hypothetical protein [Nocardia cyriacigeorgica]NEW51091.1 hypothetical protein [Nocardia cyriacigeorgica]
MLGWIKKAAVATAGVALPLVGGAVGAWVGGPIGARVGASLGGAVADIVQNGKPGWSTLGAAALSSIGAKSFAGGGRKFGFLGGAEGKAAAQAGKTAKEAYKLPAAASTPLLRGGTWGATRRGGNAAARRAERLHLAKNRKDSWRNTFNPGVNGLRWKVSKDGLRRAGAGNMALTGTGAVAGYYTNKALTGMAPKGGSDPRVPGAKGEVAFEYVGGHVKSSVNNMPGFKATPNTTADSWQESGFLLMPKTIPDALKAWYAGPKTTGSTTPA